MIIEQPPFIYRFIYKGSHWRINKDKKVVYLTFDDGPIPEVTPWVLDLLDHYNIKACFFCVGDNVRKYPEVFNEVIKRGHSVGNHTFNHLQGVRTRPKNYIDNVNKAAELIPSKLFRPPHGHIRLSQYFRVRSDYKIIMWDVVSRDYGKYLTPDKVLANVKKYTRNGSIIVFHDSIKAERNMKEALPKAIEWLLEEGYTFELLTDKTV